MNESEKSLTGFWITTRTFILAAAEDLDVDLKIYYANRDYFLMVQMAKEVMSNAETRPDGIMFHNYKKQGGKILDLAEQFGVKALQLGQRQFAQGNKIFYLDEYPVFDQGTFRKIIRQLLGCPAITAVNRRDRFKR